MLIKARVVLGLTSRDGKCPIFPGDTAVVDDAEGKRAVEAGYAWEVDAVPADKPGNISPVSSRCENPSGGQSAQNGPENANNVKGHLDRDQLEEMSFADLKALAKDMGIETGKIRSKSGMIEAILAVEVEAPIEDELPDLAPQEVIDE